MAREQHAELSWVPQVFFSTFIVLISTALTWRVLLLWRKQITLEKLLWFEKWSGFKLLLVVIAIIAGNAVLSNFFYYTCHRPALSNAFCTNHVSAFNMPTIHLVAFDWWSVRSIETVEHCLWWCDRTPRTWRTLIYSAAGWLVGEQILLYSPLWATILVQTVISFQHHINRHFGSAFNWLDWFIYVDGPVCEHGDGTGGIAYVRPAPSLADGVQLLSDEVLRRHKTAARRAGRLNWRSFYGGLVVPFGEDGGGD